MAELPENSLIARIEARLRATGKSAEGASLEAGLGRDFIRNIRAGKAESPRAENLRKLARALACSVEYLTEGRGGPSIDELSDLERQALDIARSLTIDELREWLRAGERVRAERGAPRPFTKAS